MEPEYIYEFDAFADKLTCVRVINLRTINEYLPRVSIDDNQLFSKSQRRISAELADIVDLAVAVYTADRLSVTQQRELPRHIHVTLPVRHPEVMGAARIKAKLVETLRWFTDDLWSFEFKQRQVQGRLPERQTCFPTDEPSEKEEVSLWSGGLDSAAGLYNRMLEKTAQHYTLIGTGGNAYIRKVQRQVAELFSRKFPDQVQYIPIPIRLADTEKIGKNNRPRSRGFVFMLMGAATALLKGQDNLFIYENGVGAINLAFPGAIGLDHSRAVHPISLLEMSELISALLDKPFEFRNPFVFRTKAQMCQALVADNLTDIIFSTVTCDRRQRRAVMQCGVCSSCLLRQQAITATGIQDQTPYLIDVSPTGYKPYLRAMLYQVDTLSKLVNNSNPWQSLVREYPNLIEITARQAKHDELDNSLIEHNLVQLYRTYLEEWGQVREIIQQRLLESRQQQSIA